MIEVIYKCKCMRREVVISVPAMKKGEDVKTWLDRSLSPGIAQNHALLSPFCQSRVMEYVKLEVDAVIGVGE